MYYVQLAFDRSLVGNPIMWLKQVCLALFQIAILLLLFSLHR